MTQEKLEQRVSKAVEGIPRPSYGSAVDAAITRIVRAELQKAAEIAENWRHGNGNGDIAFSFLAAEIRKLME